MFDPSIARLNKSENVLKSPSYWKIYREAAKKSFFFNGRDNGRAVKGPANREKIFLFIT